jgi:hypothetical protein
MFMPLHIFPIYLLHILNLAGVKGRKSGSMTYIIKVNSGIEISWKTKIK